MQLHLQPDVIRASAALLKRLGILGGPNPNYRPNPNWPELPSLMQQLAAGLLRKYLAINATTQQNNLSLDQCIQSHNLRGPKKAKQKPCAAASSGMSKCGSSHTCQFLVGEVLKLGLRHPEFMSAMMFIAYRSPIFQSCGLPEISLGNCLDSSGLNGK